MLAVSRIPQLVLLFVLSWAQVAFAEIQTLPVVCGEGNNALHGTLLFPTHKTKPPVVLIVAGSGPTDRDGNSAAVRGKNDSLKMLAEELAIAGFASVRFDKRGVAASLGAARDEESLRFQTYVGDVEAWIKQLSNDNRFGSVAVIGHSEGSSLAILAAKNQKVDALVSIAGPAQAASKILRTQLQGKFPPELAQANESILGKLERGEFVRDVPAPLLPLYRPSVQNYLISWFPVVPKDILGQLRLPIAIVQGDHDIQVPVSEAEMLAAAAPGSKLIIVRGMNHIFKDVSMETSKQVESYSDPMLPLNQDFVNQIVSFLRSTLVKK
ncbi:alpha/beta fold hydrolase [Undibacterium cyanobacteriorum]|uniref:Alpha/beta fold hydrolase n=1 Tax=Undibacterium cyanobacteriorum TaxID=3073561 RepID=A0ABY9RGR9_9BURK|nr:alpha/beta fold hydrolase [Undibacterium sp. 20NA77.5]WMW80420.1 alpha/beta fold hydrolase [Undibacterium sp. 20NA77.5]